MSDSISRGKVLSLLAGLPVAVVVSTTAVSAADDSAGTKAKYKYIDKPGPKGEVCIGCALFLAPAACVIVKGRISPNGYCIAYAPKAT